MRAQRLRTRAEGSESKVTREFSEGDDKVSVPQDAPKERKMNPDGTYYADESPVCACAQLVVQRTAWAFAELARFEEGKRLLLATEHYTPRHCSRPSMLTTTLSL